MAAHPHPAERAFRNLPGPDAYAGASRILAQAVTPDVLAALELFFPDRCPDLKDELKHIYFKAGQAAVVRTLKGLSETEESVATQVSEL